MPLYFSSPRRTAHVAALIVIAVGLMTTTARAVDVESSGVRRDAGRNSATHDSYEARTDFPRQPAKNAAVVEASETDQLHDAADAGPTLPLASKRLPAPAGETSPKASGWSNLLSAMGSLTIVLGLFLAVMWFVRRTGPKSMTALPNEVFEVLGRSPLAARQQAQLVRCGNKLLLLSVTAGGAETLTEITDAAEVERLTGLCQQTRPNSATASFRNLFSNFAAESSTSAPRTPRANRLSMGGLTSRSKEAADV